VTEVAAPDGIDPDRRPWLLDRYLAAQLTGDRRAALRLLLDDGLGRGIPVPNLYLDVVQAAQYRIGELWQMNRISVAQEHLATAISQVAVAELYRAAICAPSNGKSAIVACVGGELHELGARITADFFEMAGFEVRYLGANAPTDTLVAALREEQPDLLIASVTMNLHLDRWRELVLQSREAIGNKLRLAVGGHAFAWAPSLVDELGADIYGRDAPDSVSAACRLLDLAPT
jgi:MerR family transcriptional regulator, light-induced transcriptional regulator